VAEAGLDDVRLAAGLALAFALARVEARAVGNRVVGEVDLSRDVRTESGGEAALLVLTAPSPDVAEDLHRDLRR